MQGLLFNSGAPSVDVRFRHIRHIQLSATAWVEHQSGWLTGHEQVFAHLRDTLRWREESRWMYEREVAVPRLVARIPDEGDAHPVLLDAMEALSNRYEWDLSRLAACYYRTGQDSVAEHGDKMGALRQDCVIGIVSVGTPRKLLLRPAKGGRARTFKLGWGDLFVMGGDTQQSWLHGVPKQPFAEPRISVQFRPATSSQEL